MRKVVAQRDLFARSVDQIAELPGLELDERDYFRDVYDHLIRISDLIDSYRDLLSGATDLYLSTVSNRQNDVMKQLAIVATIFLPLSFITGFFGQNFGYLVTDGGVSEDLCRHERKRSVMSTRTEDPEQDRVGGRRAVVRRRGAERARRASAARRWRNAARRRGGGPPVASSRRSWSMMRSIARGCARRSGRCPTVAGSLMR